MGSLLHFSIFEVNGTHILSTKAHKIEQRRMRSYRQSL